MNEINGQEKENIQSSFDELEKSLKEYREQRRKNASDRAERDKIYRMKNRLKVLISDAISRAKKYRHSI